MSENSEMIYEVLDVEEAKAKSAAVQADGFQSEPAAENACCEGKKDPARKAGHLLMKASHMMKRAHHANCAQQHGGFDPNQGQGRVIALLQKTGPMKQSELVYLLDIRQQSLAETLGKLEKLGLIQRERSENDRRVWVVSLTEAGKAAQLNQNEPADAFDGFSDEELKQFSEYMKRIIKNLEPQVGDEAGRCGRGRGHGHGPGCDDRPRGPRGYGEPCGPHGHGEPHGPRGCGGGRDRGPQYHHDPHGCCGHGPRHPEPFGPHGPYGFQRDCRGPWC